VALSFGRSKSDDVVSLIAAKKYGPAIEILREQLKKRGASTTVRKQLADVLVLSGKTVEAVSLLLPLADKFAREGFAAKAVSVLKKIQKIDPGRRDVEERLARLIEEKQRQAAVALIATVMSLFILRIGYVRIGKLSYFVFAACLLALVPPLWRRVMDPRAARWRTSCAAAVGDGDRAVA